MMPRFNHYIFSTSLALRNLLYCLDLPAPLYVPVLAVDLDVADL
jgi:hypothetical protein